MKNIKETFEKIYRTGFWAPNEKTPRAGSGSGREFCKRIIPKLQPYFENRLFVDLGCNEKENWLPESLYNSSSYFGIDIVSDVNPHLVANLLDLDSWFPKVPSEKPRFFFIKDVMQHWDNPSVIKWLEQMYGFMTEEDLLVTMNGCRAKEKRVYKGHYAPLKLGFEPLDRSFRLNVKRIMEDWKPKTKEVLLWKKGSFENA